MHMFSNLWNLHCRNIYYSRWRVFTPAPLLKRASLANLTIRPEWNIWSLPILIGLIDSSHPIPCLINDAFISFVHLNRNDKKFLRVLILVQQKAQIAITNLHIRKNLE